MAAISESAAHPTGDRNGWTHRIETRTWRISLAGYLIVIAFLAGFVVWAAFAPLQGAAMAPGYVAAAGQDFVVSHMNGSVVLRIDVHEGERVKTGQVLLKLNPTVAQAKLDRTVNQLIALESEAATLRAKRDGAGAYTPPDDPAPDSRRFDFNAIVSDHRKEFLAGLARYKAEQNILHQRVESLQESEIGLKARMKAGEDQLSIVRSEAKRKKTLLDKGLSNRSEYTALLRTEAELIGQTGQLQSQIASSASAQLEAKQQIERLKTSRVEDAVTQLNKTESDIRDMQEQVRTARQTLDRTTIRTPTDGIIVRSYFNVPGSVIEAGKPIFEILPTTHKLIIEAHLAPQDIDQVHLGQTANLHFVALNARTTPKILGTVTYLSANRQIDERTGKPYYVARLKIADELPPNIKPEQIYPGMPVEVFIATKRRTFAEYLVRPMLDSLSQAFRQR